MYMFEIERDLAWIARNLQIVKNSIFGPKLTRHLNMDNRDFDVVDNNYNTPSSIQSSEVENVKLSRKKYL